MSTNQNSNSPSETNPANTGLSFPKRTYITRGPITPPPSSVPVRTVIPEPIAPTAAVVVEVQAETMPVTEVNAPKAKSAKSAPTADRAPKVGGGLAIAKPKIGLLSFGKMPWTKFLGGLGLVVGVGGVIVTAAYNLSPAFRLNTLLSARDNFGYYDPSCSAYKSGTTLVLRRQANPLTGASPSQRTQLQICQGGIPNGTSNAPYLMTFENGKLGIPTGVSFKIRASRNWVARNQTDVIKIDTEKAEIAKQMATQKDQSKLKGLQAQLVELDKKRVNLALAINPWLEFGALVTRADGKKDLITDLSKASKADLSGPGVLKGLLIPLNDGGDLPNIRHWESSADNRLIIGYNASKTFLGKEDPIFAFASRADNPLDGATLTIEDLNGDNAPASVPAQPQVSTSPGPSPGK